MATNLSDASIFNPSYKELPIPSYLGLSKPIDTPRAYSATASAIEGAAKIGADVVKVAHTLTQQTLDDRIHSEVDAIREPYKDELGKTLKGLQTAQVASKDGKPVVNDAASLLSDPEGAGDLPPELENLVGSVNVLGAARGNSKISRTDYVARLDTLAKEFRSQFPGWRDYIDSKIQKETGIDPANALIGARINDINRLISSNKAGQDKLLNVSYQEGNNMLPGMPERRALYQAGRMSAYQFDSWINQQNRIKYEQRQAEGELAISKATVENKKIQATVLGQKAVSQAITNDIDLVHKSMGLSSDPSTAMTELTEKTKDPTVALRFKALIESRQVAMTAQIRARLHQPIEGDPNGNSLAFYMGEDGVKTVTDNALNVHKSYSKLLGSEQFGMATYMKSMTEAMSDSNKMRLIKAIPSLQDIETIQKMAGPHANIIIPSTLKNDVSTEYDLAVSANRVRTMLRQPDPVTGKILTLKDQIAEANDTVLRDPQVSTENKREVIAKLADAYLRQIEAITDPKDPFKKEYIETAFSPEGLGLIGNLEPASKAKIINRMLDKKVTEAVFAVGGNHWNMYSDWAKTSITQEHLTPELGAMSRWVKNNSLEWNWDKDNYKFIVTPSAEPSKGPVQGPRLTLGTVQSMLDSNLNSVLGKYVTILQKEGRDVNAELFQIFRAAGAGTDVTPLLQAMINSAKKVEKP